MAPFDNFIIYQSNHLSWIKFLLCLKVGSTSLNLGQGGNLLFILDIFEVHHREKNLLLLFLDLLRQVWKRVRRGLFLYLQSRWLRFLGFFVLPRDLWGLFLALRLIITRHCGFNSVRYRSAAIEGGLVLRRVKQGYGRTELFVN